MDSSKIRQTVELMQNVCDQIAEKGNAYRQLDLKEGTTFGEILKIELLSYLAYLSASDGVISWNDCRFINEVLDIFVKPDQLNKLIEEKNIYSTEFEQKTPIMLQLLVYVDNEIYQKQMMENVTDDGELGEMLFQLYSALTVGLVDSNGRGKGTLDPNEERDAKIYLGMMKKYIEMNTARHHVDVVTNYTKTSAKRESKSGVKAPEKDMRDHKSVKAPKKG